MINKNYFKYLLKSLFPLIIVCGVIGVMSLGFFPALSFRDMYRYTSYDDLFSYVGAIDGNFLLLVAVAFAVPLVIHSRYYSKNSSDIYLSLPINRKQAFVTENLFGLMIVVGATLLGFLSGLALTGLENFQLYLVESYLQILQTFPIILLAVIISYLIGVVSVNVSNSMIEAIFVLVAINGISLLIWGVFETFFYPFIDYDFQNQISGFSYAPAITANILWGAIRQPYGEVPICDFRWYSEGLISLLINFVIWACLCYASYGRFKNLKSEHLGTAFMEKLGGPDAHFAFFGMIFIEIGALLGETIGEDVYLMQLFLVALFGTVIAYWVSLFVLRRKIIFRKDDVIRFVIAAAGGVILGTALFLAVTKPGYEAHRLLN